MRLTAEQRTAIKNALKLVDPSATVKLFGSRLDDHKKGGDIDLLIYSKTINWKDVAKLRGMLEQKLGEQKIDIVLESQSAPEFIRHIERTAKSL